MFDAFSLIVSVTSGNRMAIASIPSSYNLEDYDANTVISGEEAYAAGVVLESLFTEAGEPLFSASEIKKIKATSSFAQVVAVDDGFKCEVPTSASIRDMNMADICGYSVAAICYESVSLNTFVREAPAMQDCAKSLPALRSLPAPPLGEAQIATPEKNKNPLDAVIKKNSVPLVETILNAMKNTFIFRILDEVIFRFLDGIYLRLKDNEFDLLVSERFRDVIIATESARVYDTVRAFLKRDFELFVSEEAKCPPELWSFKGCLLNIRSGATIINHGEYFVTRCLNAVYNPTAVCPNFDLFVKSVALDDSDTEKLIWQTIGYLLSGDNRAKKFFVIKGPKDSGKSVFTDLLAYILGSDNVSFVNGNQLGERFASASLVDSLVNFCPDQPNVPLTEEAVSAIKAATGGDHIHADRKYKEPLNFTPRTRFVITSNFDVRTRTPDEAFDERMVCIYFMHRIPDNRKDYSLREKLRNEADGICLKAIGYYKELLDTHYQFSQKRSLPIPSGYGISYDVLHRKFLEDRLSITRVDDDRIATSVLYSLYTAFVHSFDIDPEEQNHFTFSMGKLLKDLGVEKKRALVGEDNVNAFIGVRYKQDSSNS